MLRFIFCLSALVAVGDFQTTSTTETPKIFEEVVGIEVDGVKKCLGAFVSAVADSKSQFIATSAHCVYGVQASRLKFSKWKDSTSTEAIQIKRVMVHPYYMPPSPDYDIALVKTDKGGEGKAFLINEDPVSTSELKILDWNSNADPEIKKASATSDDRKSCRAKMASHIVVTTRMLCANNIQPLSLMDGSLLVNDKKLVGVGSYYVRGESEKYPKIFTNIANFEIKSFIKKYID